MIKVGLIRVGVIRTIVVSVGETVTVRIRTTSDVDLRARRSVRTKIVSIRYAVVVVVRIACITEPVMIKVRLVR